MRPSGRPLGLDAALHLGQIIGRTVGIGVPAAQHEGATLPVEIAYERVEHHQRKGIVEARAAHHAAMGVHRCLAAMAGEFIGKAGDGFDRNTAGGRIVFIA